MAVVAHGHRLVLCLETLPNRPSSSQPAGPFMRSVGLYTATSTEGEATWGPLVGGPQFSSASMPQFDDRGRMLLLSDRRLWISETYGAAWQARLVALPAGRAGPGPQLGRPGRPLRDRRLLRARR